MYLVKLIAEEGGYSAIVPSLPGCGSQGDTAEEAIQNVREAIELHVEGLVERQLPVPPSDVPAGAPELLVAV
jgi:predicted RNase H-like HicB family nuclease